MTKILFLKQCMSNKTLNAKYEANLIVKKVFCDEIFPRQKLAIVPKNEVRIISRNIYEKKVTGG